MDHCALLLLDAAAAVAAFLAVLCYVVAPGGVKVPIKGRHVFVTAGSSGIGLSLAKQATAEGDRVSILARNLRKLEEAHEEIRRATGVEAAIYSVEVRDEKAVREALEEAGTVDVLLVMVDMEEVRYTIDINVVGTFNLIRHALPAMKQAAGGSPSRSIAVISSQADQIGVYGYTSYSASKFALRGLAEALQQESSITSASPSSSPGRRNPWISRSSGRHQVGKFLVTCNQVGSILSLTTADEAPANSVLAAFSEVVFAGVMRLIALFILHGWYSTIVKWNARQRRKAEKMT
ncbi:unnamed protein product [Spirodela intermedia]|uniref:Uncharacterized protein n=1 Tax=Spirodela intermedia TaxID=51605 RepID=A0A7I8JUJ1_SPIIN|nr:unnamed protein product [Spirodela intermedia]CAA6673858.1 unnamed protein product [Spirodela intermedia]